jgi:hypothetical protein
MLLKSRKKREFLLNRWTCHKQDVKKKSYTHHRSRQTSWHQPYGANLKALEELQKKAKKKPK